MLSLLFLPLSLTFRVLGRATSNIIQRGSHITHNVFLDHFHCLPYGSFNTRVGRRIKTSQFHNLKTRQTNGVYLRSICDIVVHHDK